MTIRSITLRLALIYTAAFVLAVTALAAAVLPMTRAILRTQFETRIQAEASALVREFDIEGLEEVAHAVRERDRTPGSLDYGLERQDQTPVAGRLASIKAPTGWSNYELREPGREPRTLHILATPLPDGHRLLVGDDLAHISSLDGVLLSGFGLAILGIALLGGAGGYILSQGDRRRFAAIGHVADAISEGDLGQRVEVGRSNDDLGHLGRTFNRMLDRIGVLLDSLQQVSNDVAHDLRTPLTRLRQRLEAAQTSDDVAMRTQAIEEAMAELDAILETFSAILRISQVESGGRRSGFRRLDLAALARDVVESFAPSAEEGGRTLVFEGRDGVMVFGDAELLTQMVVNLVENSLGHTPENAHVRVGVVAQGAAAVLQVVDNGPGVPPGERAAVFKRFYRLERSRTKPGNGLGLALVGAIAKLHDTEVELDDANPGLEVRVRFARDA